MKIHDCEYDKLKLLYKFCKIRHFIDKHAEVDAKKIGDEAFHKLLVEVDGQLDKYIEQLHAMVCK